MVTTIARTLSEVRQIPTEIMIHFFIGQVSSYHAICVGEILQYYKCYDGSVLTQIGDTKQDK